MNSTFPRTHPATSPFLPHAATPDTLAALIQSARDHGVLSYNDARRQLGLPPAVSFDELTGQKDLAARLQRLYGRLRCLAD